MFELARASAYGIVQGAAAELGGGEFRDGFLGGSVGSFGGHLLEGSVGSTMLGDINMNEVIAAAVVGGTAAELGGGKFANGAYSAAFSSLVNQQAQANRQSKAEGAQDNHDIWERDDSGDIVSRELEGTQTVTRANGDQVTWQEVELKASNGRWYKALRRVSGPEGYASNCHGDCLGTRDRYWIDPDVMKRVVNAFYEPTKSFNEGTLVVFISNGDYVHSGIISTRGATLRDSIWMGDDGGLVPPVRASVGNTADYYKSTPKAFNRKQ